MSTTTAALVTVVVLAAAGTLPVLALVGWRWVTVPLIPLGGSVVAALATAATVAIGGSVEAWFVGLAVGGAVLVVGVWWARPASRPGRRAVVPSGTAAGPGGAAEAAGRPFTGWPAFVAVVAATASSLVALRTPSVGFDARTIWMLHARWYVQGHATSLAALRNTALPFAHAAYPPLVSGTVAVAWAITGLHTDRFGVVVVALLNAMATAAAAWALVDLGRRAGRVPSVVGTVVAPLLVLTAFGVAGPFATNGYADMLWAASAVGAVAYGLVLTGRRSDLGAAAVLLAVAGLTKDEGYVTAMAVVVFLAARTALSAPSGRPGRWWRPTVGGALGIGALGAWAALTRLLHAAPNAPAPGPRDGTDSSRLHDSVVSMAPHLHVLMVAVAATVVGGIVAGRTRRALGIGADGWAWAALAAGLAVVLVAYVTGSANIELWLITSTHRTTIYGALLGWWLTATWAVIASAHGVSAHGVRSPWRRSNTSTRSA